MLLRVMILVSVSLSTTACGWHLQGNERLPPIYAATHIETEDRYTDFYRELRRAMIASGAQVLEQSEHARTIVRLRHDDFGERVSALSSRNTAEEFQVYYSVDYSVTVDGVEVAPTQHLELTTNYSYDANTVLGKQREQLTIQQALARELATVVLRRLASVSTRTQ